MMASLVYPAARPGLAFRNSGRSDNSRVSDYKTTVYTHSTTILRATVDSLTLPGRTGAQDRGAASRIPFVLRRPMSDNGMVADVGMPKGQAPQETSLQAYAQDSTRGHPMNERIRICVPLVVFTLLAGLLALNPPAAQAETASILALRPGATLEPPAVSVLAEDEGGVQLVIDLPALSLESYELEGATFQTLAMSGGQLVGRPGEPALPEFTRFVAIPATCGVGLRVVSVEEETYSGLRLLPMQADEGSALAFDRELYARDEFLGGEPVTVGAPAVLRDLRVVPLSFHPVRFNPLRGEVRVVRRIEVAIDHLGVDLRNTKTRGAAEPSELMRELYASIVVNCGSGGQRGEVPSPHRGTWLIISPSNSQVISLLQPLLAWRERMGFNVVHVTTTETGTTNTSIKNWIQQAYNTWEYPPEYVVLVGDASGTIALPTFYETYSGYNGEGDHPYVQLDGTDQVPDAFIGRLSADSYTTLERIVNKIIGYEAQPYMQSTDWFTRATLTGDPIDSGPTCVHIQQWLKERLRQVGYTQIDTIFAQPFESQTIARLNQGNTFYGYRGIYGMSGVSAGDISSLQNGWKLTFAINLTCDTGSWASGTSRSEAWLRGGSGASTPTAGIGSIGTATTGTHTRFNNCFYAGGAYGLFWNKHHCIGMSHARGKLQMILDFGEAEPTQAARYCHWNTLIGDPATIIWTGVPQALTVDYPATVPVGSNMVRVNVSGPGGAAVGGAWVHLHREGVFSHGGLTDETGQVELPIEAATAGTVLVTVTGTNLYAHQGSFEIQEADRFVSLQEYTIDDDATAPSHGNGDGVLNPGEEVALTIGLHNFGIQQAQNVALTATCDDPLVGWTAPTTVNYGTIGGYQTVEGQSPLVLRLYGGCPAGHVVRIALTISSGSNQWEALLAIPVSGQELVYYAHTLNGVGSVLDPGESGTIAIKIENVGSLAAPGPIEAMLASDDYAVEVTDAHGTYGTIAAGGTATNTGDPFGIRSPAGCIPTLANLRVMLVDAQGVRQTVRLVLPVGTADSHDPTGPDAYGYYAYDHTDTDYDEAPSYQWVDINPGSGGPGTSVGLTDMGDNQDDSRTLDLPFIFRYYGQDFDRVTICSNGWLSFGQTYQVTFANYAMPCSWAPDNMIAAFWDDLYQTTTGRVYHWHDESQHRYIVAWDNVQRRVWYYPPYTESFEIILYDPAYYPTATGDGEILMQFETVNNVDSEGMYATCGIQDAEHTTGITFNYFARRPTTAANLAGGLAVKFTTGAPDFSSAGERQRPTRLALRSGPTPWSAGTTIRFDLPVPAEVTLRVLDLNGRTVRLLARGTEPAGSRAVCWSGTDDQGVPLPAGIYLLRLDAGGEQITRRTVLVR